MLFLGQGCLQRIIWQIQRCVSRLVGDVDFPKRPSTPVSRDTSLTGDIGVSTPADALAGAEVRDRATVKPMTVRIMCFFTAIPLDLVCAIEKFFAGTVARPNST